MRHSGFIAALLTFTLILSACGGAGGGDAALPPAGTIWFGGGINAPGSSPGLGIVGRSSSLAVSNSMWFIAHLTAKPNAGWGYEINGCKFPDLNNLLSCNGYLQPNLAQLVDVGSDTYVVGMVSALVFPIGSTAPLAYAMTIEDTNGTGLASGTLTITP